MTLKYESELLYELMKRDGDDTPSSVLPYESELKEKYLNQVVGAYPKLQDYRPEWLNYNLYHHLPSDFPVETVTNGTNATFQNVVPYAFKSAILRGQTLVNISSLSGEITIKPGSIKFIDSPLIKQNTTYTFMFNCTSAPSTGFIEIRQMLDNTTLKEQIINIVQGYNKLKVTTDNKELNRFRFKNDSTSETDFIFNNLMILDGDYTNVDIPYFEGMQSVQMPVLTTSNEDGTKTNILTCNEEVTLRGIGGVKDELNLLTGELTKRIGEIVLDGSENGWSKSGGNTNESRYGMVLAIGSMKSGAKIVNDRFVNGDMSSNTNVLNYIYSISSYGGIVVTIDNSKLETIDSSGFKKWLSQNPITVHYELAQESFKTVDLTCIDEHGENANFMPIEGTMHVSTSSQTIPPLLEMSVPVEAIEQNLNSFAHMEEEE